MPQQQQNDFSDFNQVLSQPPQDFSDFNAVLGQPQQPQESYYQQLKRNVGLGFRQLGQKVADVAATGYEIGREALHGNFAPARETAEIAARSAAPYVSALGNPALAAPNFISQSVQQAAPLAEVKARQAQRREASG